MYTSIRFRYLPPLLLLLLLCGASSLRAQMPKGPLVWLRADSGVVLSGDTVTRWRDISGHGYDALPVTPAGRPTYDMRGIAGKPVVRFSGKDQFLRFPDIFPVSDDYTKVIVTRIWNFSGVNNLLSGTKGHALWLGGNRYPKMFQSGSSYAVSLVPASDDWNLIVGTFSHESLRGQVFVNGAFGASGIAPVPNVDSTLYLGSFAGGFGMNGDVAEVLIYNRVLSTAGRDSVERYLAAKYGLTLIPPQQEFPFTAFPEPLQLYQRRADDSAEVPIAGTVTMPGVDSVRVEVHRSGALWKSLGQRLVYGPNGAPFSLSPTIHARPAEYSFRVYLRIRGRDSLIGSRDSILCGDMFIIAGQSNSVFFNPSATFRSEYCRTFGTNTAYTRYDESDTLWGIARGNGSSGGRFNVGAWGIRLQQYLLEQERIPSCVINGGVGGSSIEQNKRNDRAPADLGTIYGRTLYRAEKAGGAATARALIWYQGESNGIGLYWHNFKQLYNGWRTDYPGLEKIYVVQIRPGCGANPTHGELRELQRTLPDSLPLIAAYATTGIPGHDGCHYSGEGYTTIGAQLYRLIARDLYRNSDSMEVASPNLERAYWASPTRDEIVLRFAGTDQHLIWPDDVIVDSVLRRMVDQFFLDGKSGEVIEGSAEGNIVRLKLKGPSTATRITYVPPVYYEGTNTIYEGPWLINRRGVGAFTFNDVPIHASVSTTPVPAMEREKLVAMPNPAGEMVTLRLEMEESAFVWLEFRNMLGEVMLRQEVGTMGSGFHMLPVRVRDLPPGHYRCIVHAGNDAMGREVVVVR